MSRLERVVSFLVVLALFPAGSLAATIHMPVNQLVKPIIRTLDSAGNVGTYSSIARGAGDYAVVSYHDGTNGDLKLAKCNDASCSSPSISTLDSAGTTGRYTSIAIGRDGYPDGRIFS